MCTSALKTEAGKTYWNKSGKFQNEYNFVWDKMVPASGEPENPHAKAVWAIGRLYYEWCNNGNGNSVDVMTESCESCYGSGTSEDYEDCGCGGDEDCEDCGGVGEVEGFYDCSECGGTGECETDTIITEFYAEMLDYLKKYIQKQLVEKLEEFMLDSYYMGYGQFNERNYQIYNDVADQVMLKVCQKL